MSSEKAKETFGSLLKKIRAEDADIALRAFADMTNMSPSNLSNIERDRVPPPANRKTIVELCDSLGLAKNDPRREKLFDLAAEAKNRIPADAADGVKNHAGVPVFVGAVANEQLAEDQLRELTEYVKKFY